MAGELVLIVEDNERNLKLARDLLRFRGFRTVEAVTAGSGIAAARKHAPHLILMDIQLPDMDGTSALDQLRADPATSDIRVVALTAFAMRDDRDRLMEAGFDAYIAKPIDVKEFPSQVQHQCNLAHAARKESAT